jgi:single-strand DNA-binding protein
MILVGVTRIGNDPIIRHTPGGDAVLDLSLAYNHGKKLEDGKKATQWVSATLWGPRAEKMAEYLKKGTTVFVSGSDVHVETYKKKDGTPGFNLKCRIDSIEFVAGTKVDKAETKPAGNSFAGLDDDIPF